MSNDEIKNFIDHSKLYAEVDFEHNQKVEEGVFDFIKGLFKSDDEAEEVIKKADPTVVKKLDKAVDDNNLDAFGGAGTTVVTTQDQANSISQNPNATDAERQAAQEFYGKEKTSSNKGPQVDTGAGANAQAGLGQTDTSSDTAGQTGGQTQTSTAQDNNPNTDGGQAADPDANDPRGDQTNPPANQQGIDGPATAQDNNPNTDGGQAATSTGQDNNPNTDGGQAATSTGQDNNPNTDGGQAATSTGQDNNPNTGPEIDTADPSKQGIDGPSNAAAMAAGQAGAASATAPSNGSLLGRKLDTTTPNLMKAYNDGGKKAMPAIKNLQTALSRLGHDPNGIDGKYGNGTYSAVQAFQKANGLSVDGQAGPGTMAAIKKALDDNFEKNKAKPDAQENPAGSGQDNNPNAPTDQEGGVAQGIDQADAQTKASDAQLIAKGQAAKADAQNKASDAQLIAKAQSAEPKVSKELYVQMAPNRNASLGNFNVSQMKAKYPKPYLEIPNKDGTVTRGYGPLKNLEDFVANKGKKFKAKIIGKPVQQAGTPNAERDATERGVQTASKDNNMKKAIKEASMNISINGDSAAEVAELAGILKNAGMHDAKPVSDIMAPPIDHGHMDGHDDMVSKMRMMDEPAPDDSPCGMGEEGVEEASWDNSPDETYADTQTMTKDLSGGLNREKKSYPATQDGDNPMAVENSIKEQLWAALNEKMTAEGRGRGKKMKLKASRGNEDIKTTEGSRGKSRGKKSRG